MNIKQKQIISTMFPDLAPRLGDTNAELLKMIFAGIQQIKGDKGDKGDKPVKGRDYFTDDEIRAVIKLATPIKGKDYFTRSEIRDIIAEATPVKGRDYYEGRDGKDYVLTNKDKREIASLVDVPIVEKVIEKIEIIKEVSKPIDVSMVKDAVSKKDLLTGMERVDGRLKLIDQRWHGGGSSGSSRGFTKLTTTSTIDDSNTVFVFTDVPTYLIINSGWYDNTAGAPYTWTGTTTVTLNNVVGSGGCIWGFK